jgi:dihydroorotate dehydrogenase
MSSEEIYRKILRPLLFLLDPERAHDLAIRSLQRVSQSDLLLRRLRRFQPPVRPVTVFGLTFPNQIGLAAGFDKNGVALPAWAALGFGFIEIGTVTSKAQAGNPKPRIFRYSEQQALINRLGFNNDGADAVANRLRQCQESGRWPKVPVGINLGKSKTTPVDQAPSDYLHSFRRLRRFADYVVLNVSSPNTPGLRSLQEPESLSILVRAIREENRMDKPVLVKIAPDLSIMQLEEIIAVCVENNIAGIIATNTTLDHASIPKSRDQEGGLSGVPLREKATALVREITARSTIPVIACGGIFDVPSAREKIEAGAKLLQVYTGYVYRGPTLLREISNSLGATNQV